MLFRKKIEPLCTYCKHGEMIDEESIICPKRGVVSAWQSCKHFTYDPLKREPEPQLAPMTDVDESIFANNYSRNEEGMSENT